MNNPVLLPKRKDYGFLKPPSAPAASSMIFKRATNLRSNRSNGNHPQKIGHTYTSHFMHPATTCISSPDLTAPEHMKLASKEIDNYTFDSQQLKYGYKSAPVSRGKPNASNSFNHIGKALIGSFNKRKSLNNINRQSNKNSQSFADRQTYTAEGGTNISNQTRKHQHLSIGANRFENSQLKNSYDVYGPEVTGSNTGFAASRLLVKREKTSIDNCTKCGKLYYDYKCLNCEFGKRKFLLNWKPSNARNKDLLQKRFGGFASVSTSIIDQHMALKNRPSLNSQIQDQIMAKQIKKPGTDMSHRSNETVKKNNQLSVSGVNNKFTEFDMSFKYDVKSAVSRTSDEKEKDANKPAKLTLYLI